MDSKRLTNGEQLPPHDEAAEAALLGSILYFPEQANTVLKDVLAAGVTAESFFKPHHRTIFSAFERVAATQCNLNFITVGNDLDAHGQLAKVGGHATLASLPERCPWPNGWPDYVAIVLRKAAQPKTTQLVSRSNGTIEYLPSDNDGHLGTEEPEIILAEVVHPWPAMQDGAAICAMDLPPPVEIVAGLMTEQCKFMIASSAKSYKTWLTLYMAIAIAHGIPFLGRPTLRRRVVYFNLELRPVTFWRRVQIVTRALGISALDPAWFHVQSLRGCLGCSPIATTIGLMLRRIKEVKAEVAVIDPVYKLNTEGEENSSRDQTRLFNEIDRLTTEGEVAVIICDHFSKGSQADKDPLDAIRGSSAKGGDVDAALILRVHETPNCYSAHAVLRELPPADAAVLKFAFPLFEPCANLDPEDMKRPSTGRKKEHSDVALLSAIKDSTRENPVSDSQWAELAGLTRTTLRGYLPSLRQREFTVTIGEGTASRKFISAKGLVFLAEHK